MHPTHAWLTAPAPGPPPHPPSIGSGVSLAAALTVHDACNHAHTGEMINEQECRVGPAGPARVGWAGWAGSGRLGRLGRLGLAAQHAPAGASAPRVWSVHSCHCSCGASRKLDNPRTSHALSTSWWGGMGGDGMGWRAVVVALRAASMQWQRSPSIMHSVTAGLLGDKRWTAHGTPTCHTSTPSHRAHRQDNPNAMPTLISL